MCCRGDIRWFRVSVSVSHLNLLNMIETKKLCASSSKSTDILMMRRGWSVLISGVIVQRIRLYHTNQVVMSLQSPIDHPFHLMMVLYWTFTFISLVSCLWIYIFYFHVESLCFVRSLTNYIGLKLLIYIICYTIYRYAENSDLRT